MARADELRVDQPCTVADLRTGTNHPAVIKEVPHSGESRVIVLYDEDQRFRAVDCGFITLGEGDDRS